MRAAHGGGDAQLVPHALFEVSGFLPLLLRLGRLSLWRGERPSAGVSVCAVSQAGARMTLAHRTLQTPCVAVG